MRDRPAEVLLVDDYLPATAVLGELLRDAGFLVRVFNDPKAALLGAIAMPPDVVVADLLMPRQDGDDMMKELWKIHPDIPVVFVSASDDVAGTLGGILSDPSKKVRILHKPFGESSSLVAVINEILGVK